MEVVCVHWFSLMNNLPQTFGLFLNQDLIGMYQFTNRDLFCRPDIYPWVANLYIDNKYRKKGYSKLLIKSVKENAQKNLQSNTLYLFTNHLGLYEKFDWEFFCDVESFDTKTPTEKIYKLNL